MFSLSSLINSVYAQLVDENDENIPAFIGELQWAELRWWREWCWRDFNYGKF